jgi:hypothetical protein
MKQSKAKHFALVTLFAATATLAGCSKQPFPNGPGAAQPTPVNASMFTTGAVLPCSDEPYLNSLESRQPVKMVFQNLQGSSTNFYWLDYQGHRKLYRTIEAGRSFSIMTFVTHPWVVTDAADHCTEIVMPGPTTQTAVIQPSPPSG